MDWKKCMENIRSCRLRKDPVCPWWLAYTFDNPLRRFLHDTERLLSPYVKRGMTVADIGCGMGYFSLGMARLVGENGSVLAVDIQQKMLHTMLRRTEKQGLVGRIRPVLADKRDIGIREPVDFVLAFWMVHETEDVSRFLGQVFSLLNKGGTVLIAEPRMHVPERKFREILQHARAAGFQVGKGPDVRISRSALLSKR